MAEHQLSREEEDVFLRYKDLHEKQELAEKERRPKDAETFKELKKALMDEHEMHHSKHLSYMATARSIEARRNLGSTKRSDA
jgi:hypothetical protein